jgi:hypothetical protein
MTATIEKMPEHIVLKCMSCELQRARRFASFTYSGIFINKASVCKDCARLDVAILYHNIMNIPE